MPDAVTPRIRTIFQFTPLEILRPANNTIKKKKFLTGFTIYDLLFTIFKMEDKDFYTQLRDKATLVNNTLRFLLSKRCGTGFQPVKTRPSPLGPTQCPWRDLRGWPCHQLKEALVYVIEAPGKRIRSVLALWCCELVSGQINHNAEIAAAAIEMVHTYSLVHDDLPAMDNDDFRRGRLTCHKAFDEATAILAGDALLTLAFEILAKEIDQPTLAVRLISQLAEDAGPAGMIEGQMADLRTEKNHSACHSCENRNPEYNNRMDSRLRGNDREKCDSEKLLEYIHTNKTAKMFRCSAAMGAICGGANDRQLKCLCEYGLKIGLGFQIADDILDVSASTEQLGKTAGKDERAGKVTYPAVVGMEKSRQMAKKLADEAVAALEPFGEKADTLRQLAMALSKRTK